MKYTAVFKWPEGQEPRVGKGDGWKGGELCAVSFNDALDELQRLREAAQHYCDTSEDGMNIMHRLCDRTDWIAPFPGRDHHANWCADVTHPDMRLMAAAPDLAAALQALYERYVMAIGNEGPETLAARAALEKAGFETYNA